MLLELLSDFQISIPELGRIEARTQPVVLLTSNNSRELTEALKRRCLYLWLDYPELEHELADRAPARARAVRDGRPARWSRSSAWCATSTSRSRPRSPSRSTGRARCCCSAPTTSTPTTFRETMSIIVKHRTDLDIVAERVGVKLQELGTACADLGGRMPEAGPPGLRRPGARLRRGARAEGVAIGTSRAARRLRRARRGRLDRRGALPRGARRHAGQVPGGPARLRPRLRPLLLPRRRGRGRAPRASASRSGSARRRGRATRARSTSTRCASDRPGDAATAPRRRCATSPGWRSPPSGAEGEGSGVIGVDVQRIRRALGLRSEPQPELPAGRPAPRGHAARGAAPLRGAPAPRARARPDRAHRGAAAVAPAQRARPRAAQRARCRTSPPSTASSPSSSAAWPRRATSARATAATPTSTCAARCAPRCRPAASRSS